MVNDLGVSLGGEGDGTPVAEQVAEEIRASGGRAVANRDSVASWQGAQHIVEAALDAFGRIDGVVNNAGNLRDSLFHKMTEEEFNSVIAVHLKGSFNVSRAAAPHFKAQASGAYVHMTSTSGLVGNFGQANYSAAKLGIVGLSKSIALDMHRFGVRSNAVAPFAWTRMINSIPTNTPEQQKRVEGLKKLVPEKIAPFVTALPQRRRRGRDRADLRRAQQRDLSLLAATPDPHRAYVGRVDAGDDRRARLPDVRERFLSAAALWRNLHLGSCLTMGFRPDLLLAHSFRRRANATKDATPFSMRWGSGSAQTPSILRTYPLCWKTGSPSCRPSQ